MIRGDAAVGALSRQPRWAPLDGPLAPDLLRAAAEGAQRKINMRLARLPRLRGRRGTAEEAFTGTFHVNEGYDHLQQSYREAAAGRVPDLPPCEAYCHSLTDPSILSPELMAAG